MKACYERPMIMVEEFTVNRAIAACGDEVNRDITFDCMIGPDTDTTNVLLDGCDRVAGTTKLTTASASNSHSHSNHTGGTWSNSGNPRTYTAPSDAIGLIYFCSATNGTSCFSTSGNTLTHTTNHGDRYHVQIAPLYGASIEQVNVGS